MNRLNFARLLNVIYSVMAQNQDEKKMNEIDASVWPVDQKRWGHTAEAEAGQQALMGMFG